MNAFPLEPIEKAPVSGSTSARSKRKNRIDRVFLSGYS